MGFQNLCRTLTAAVAAPLLILTLTTTAATAQWGGPYSGKTTIPFSKKFAPRQIIVSFGDRRLYYVKSRGRALAYPIAIPASLVEVAGQNACVPKAR